MVETVGRCSAIAVETSLSRKTSQAVAWRLVGTTLISFTLGGLGLGTVLWLIYFALF